MTGLSISRLFNISVLAAVTFVAWTSVTNAAAVLVPTQSTWKYDATGTDLGITWRDVGYDDAPWGSGAGILGYGETYINSVIPFGPSASNKYPTTYFRLTFNLPFDPSLITKLTLRSNYDDGVVMYVNGNEAARASMSAGTVTYTTLAISHESGAYEAIDISGALNDLTVGTNLLAIEVHQTSASSSDLAWDAELVADTSKVQFIWAGGVTESSVRVMAKVYAENAIVRLMVDGDSLFPSPVYSTPDTAVEATNNRVVDVSVSGLSRAQEYFYAPEIDGAPSTELVGRFRTFPSAGTDSFTIALGSCSSTGSTHAVYTTIRDHDPILFLDMGDLHYENISVNDPDVFRAAYETVLASSTQSALYQRVPIAYIWDDHDYGPNNSDSTAPGREAARLTYQEYVPHYPLAAGAGDVPIYQSFVIGRVYFILTDSRSARSPSGSVDNAAKTMLGTVQKAWFKQQLLDANDSYPLIVWVNSLPWIGTTGDDGWHLYTTERRELADFIANNGIDGLCMVSGDAHMLAIDNGTNNEYATNGGAVFPVFHAAALDRSGSLKGGPYSEGAFPGGGQFGLMHVVDTGGPTIDVRWSGRNWLDQEFVHLEFSVPTAGGEICDHTCHADGNCDGIIDIADVLKAVDVVFAGASQHIQPLAPVWREDVNCDGTVNVRDVVYLIDFVLRGGMAPCTPCMQ